MIDRINLILRAKNITARQFAEEIGIQPSGMSHILGGRNNPSLDFALKVLRRYPEIDANWLLLGHGQMYGTTSPTPAVPTAPAPPAAPTAHTAPTATTAPASPSLPSSAAGSPAVATAAPATPPSLPYPTAETSPEAPTLFSVAEPTLRVTTIEEIDLETPPTQAPEKTKKSDYSDSSDYSDYSDYSDSSDHSDRPDHPDLPAPQPPRQAPLLVMMFYADGTYREFHPAQP